MRLQVVSGPAFRRPVTAPADPAAEARAGPAARARRARVRRPRCGMTEFLARRRRWVFAGAVLLLALCFNGQWRPNLDSALYRGVARDLAERGTYTIAGWPEPTAYPGLPVVLAGFQLAFGDAAWPAVLAMNLVAVAVLALTYRLIAPRFGPGVAIVAVVGVATNSEFLQAAQELQTDMPFLLGVVLAWLGWEKVTANRGRATGAGLVVVGLAIAAATRPTFWVLAAAWVLVGLWQAVRGRPGRGALGVLAVAAVAALAVAADPRFAGMRLFQGGHESRLIEALGEAHRWPGEFLRAISREMNALFYGETMSPGGLLWGLLVLGAIGFVTPRRPLWGATALVLVGVTAVLSSVPRYYLMVLPALWVGWVLMWAELARWTAVPAAWLRGRGRAGWVPADVRGWTMLVGLLLPILVNIAGVANLVGEQRAVPFLEHYQAGKWATIKAAAEEVRRHTRPGDVVVGPHGNVMAYWAGRAVVGDMLAADTGRGPSPVRRVMDRRPRWMLGPQNIYRDRDEYILGLLKRGEVYMDEPTLWLDAAYLQGQQLFLATPREIMEEAEAAE